MSLQVADSRQIERCGTKPGNLQTEEWHVITSGVHQAMFENVSMGSDMIDLQLQNPTKNNYQIEYPDPDFVVGATLPRFSLPLTRPQ